MFRHRQEEWSMSSVVIQQIYEAGLAHHRAGRLREAEASYGQLLAMDPGHLGALHLMGLLAQQFNRHDVALDYFSRAIWLGPEVADYHTDMGNSLMAVGKIDAAIQSFRKAVSLKPAAPEIHFNLGNALYTKGQLSEAIAAYKQAIARRSNYFEAHANLGNALLENGDIAESIDALNKAVFMCPGSVEVHNNLANAIRQRGDLDLAVAHYRKALSLRPGCPITGNNLGNVYRAMGRISEAMEFYNGALRADPKNHEINSNRIYSMHFHPAYDTPAICAELARWNSSQAAPLSAVMQPHANDRSPDRRLRIGYVSPDFREHVVGWNLLPVLSHHDHGNFEIFCYSSVLRPDAMTERLKSQADVWRSLLGIPHAQAAQIIREDKIDILVDLSLHTAQNRLLLFAQKPAPVQATYLGYCSSTGLQTIDFRFSDPYLDPPELGRQYAEKTICLPKTYWCYQPGGPTPEVNALPALSAGHITFGCLNNFAKVSDGALQLWAAILAALPGSKLLLHAPEGSHRNRVYQFIPKERIELVGKQNFEEYIRTYQRIDIALDPFPYGGGITTCDALWMGVPVVTLEGKTAVGRAGKSILCNLGLPELVARTTQQYQQIATALAQDKDRLSTLRAGLRDKMKSSPLMDAKTFTRDVESIYRGIWRHWCQSA
jgi:predicted O-linked N-acetylglucosamine transferase (SPINDLY family)